MLQGHYNLGKREVYTGSRSRLFGSARCIRSESGCAGLILLEALATRTLRYLDNYLREAIAYQLRQELFDKLPRLSMAFHDRQQVGNMMSRATSDVDAARRFAACGIYHGAFIALYAGGAFVLLFLANYRLSLIVALFFSIALWHSLSVVPRMVGNWRKAHAQIETMTAVVQKTLSGLRVVKAFGGQTRQQSQLEQSSEEYRRHMVSAALISVNRRELSTLLLSAATGAILWIGAPEVATGRLTAGQLASSILYIGIISGEMFWAGFMVTTFTRAHAAGQRVFKALDAESPVQERARAVAMPRAKGQVRFESVSMHYTSERPAIRDVNFEVRPGQLMAVLGAPGSGKSTIVHLIPRLYDPIQSRITIDGHDVKDVTLDSLKRNIGIVLQDSFAFATTIKENIDYGANRASMDEIVRAAKIAQLHDQIAGFSDGYDPLLLFPVQRDCLHGDIFTEQLRGVTITDLSQKNPTMLRSIDRTAILLAGLSTGRLLEIVYAKRKDAIQETGKDRAESLAPGTGDRRGAADGAVAGPYQGAAVCPRSALPGTRSEPFRHVRTVRRHGGEAGRGVGRCSQRLLRAGDEVEIRQGQPLVRRRGRAA